MVDKKRLIIMGAGGRDFHNFNLLYRNDPGTIVVAFTSSQIPFQEGRLYPAVLAGTHYPKGIPIVSEEALSTLVENERVDEVILAYSDLSHQQVMETASKVLALGADFRLVGPQQTMLKSSLPAISVCAVRTGCGKSPITRFLCHRLQAMGRNPVVVRHPMAYGELEIRAVQQFQDVPDLDKYRCTLEEREEFEPLIRMGIPLFAGVDYREILTRAENAGDVLVWDGGNNDFPFIRPDLEIVLTDPCRPGDEMTFYPGLVNLRRAKVVVLTKTGEATADGMRVVRENIAKVNRDALVISGDLEVEVDNPALIMGKKVVVVEDGPTLTHGGMAFGAGVVAARRFGAQIIDPRPFATGSLADTYREFPHLKQVVPAMGYSEEQLEHLQETLEAVPCELVLSATPVDLGRLLELSRPIVRVTYEFREVDGNALEKTVRDFLSSLGDLMNG